MIICDYSYSLIMNLLIQLVEVRSKFLIQQRAMY